MTTDTSDKTYYCTQCHIETTLARVCPKCHRKTTLRPRGQSSGEAGRPRRRASSAQVATVGGSRSWLWLAGGGLAALALGSLIWWSLTRRSDNAPPKGTHAVATPPHTPAASGNRVFGAPRPGRRLAPPPPPRICGTAYRATLRFRFDAPKAAPKPALKKTASKAAQKSARPRPAPPTGRKGPEALEHRQTFLLARRSGGWTWAVLSYEVRITLGGRTLTGLKLDRTGGVLPDPRTRRPRRLGFHDTLQPGLRVSDLIGRGHADLVAAAAGGVKVKTLRLRNQLVAQWLTSSIGLADFLRPRPPKANARVFEDRRLPNPGLTAGHKLEALVRRFRLQPTQQPAPAGAVTYLVDAPALTRRRAKSTTPVQGKITLIPAEPLPRVAELVLGKLPRKGGGTQTVTLSLSHLGKRCNDK